MTPQRERLQEQDGQFEFLLRAGSKDSLNAWVKALRLGRQRPCSCVCLPFEKLGRAGHLLILGTVCRCGAAARPTWVPDDVVNGCSKCKGGFTLGMGKVRSQGKRA